MTPKLHTVSRTWRCPETKFFHLSFFVPATIIPNIWLAWFDPYEHLAVVWMGFSLIWFSKPKEHKYLSLGTFLLQPYWRLLLHFPSGISSSALNIFGLCILDSTVIMVQLSPWLPCAAGEPVLIGSNLMTLSHHRVKLQKRRTSCEDAMKWNHHHPWLPRVHVGGHQSGGSSGALAAHSGRLINDNGDSSICFSTNAACFLLLHLLYELTSCALPFPQLASRMAQSTLCFTCLCQILSLWKIKISSEIHSSWNGPAFDSIPYDSRLLGGRTAPFGSSQSLSLQTQGKKVDPLSSSLHNPVKTSTYSLGNDLSE